MSKKLKVGVIGLKVGKLHLTDYKNNGNIYEICICTRNGETLDKVGEEFSVAKRYTDFDELLKNEKPDAISITTPNETHFSLVLKALKKGVNVLVEKPFTINAKQAKILKRVSEKNKVVLAVNYNKRYEPAIYALKKLAESGKIGEILHIEAEWLRPRGIPWWFPLENGKKHIGGGPIIDLGAHIIDIAMYLSNCFDAEYVSANAFYGIGADLAQKRNIRDYNVEDGGVGFVSLKNGTTVGIKTSWAYNGEKEGLDIFVYGSKKSAGIIKGECIIYEPCGEEVIKHKLVLPDSVPNVRDVFIDAVLKNGKAQCTASEGLGVMRVIDAFYKSAKNRKPVKVK